MQQKYREYIEGLNKEQTAERLQSLKSLKQMIDEGKLERPESGVYVNNHIHTIYSFSPYSPSKAIWMAYNSGLTTAGIMDHDSISGAKEFIEAGKIIDMATTIGVECRADFSGTRLNGKRINNPDQKSIAYVTMHGIPHQYIDHVKDFFKPYTAERNKRNSLMVDKINNIFKPHDIHLDFEQDVVAISKSDEGGSITERHILFGLAGKLMSKFGKGENLVNFLKDRLGIQISQKNYKYLMDKDNKFYQYDLLGVLKGDLVRLFYIDATKECPDIKEVINLTKDIGAISAYAYLGDVTDSVTGDKKAQKFEDDYIELLFDVLKELQFDAVTYMPSRNTLEQLKRIKHLCNKYDFFQISGEDINSPRQSFICPALNDKEFKNLIDSTWALIGHEKAATKNKGQGMFSDSSMTRYPDLDERTRVFKEIGLNG
ncbi:MAG: PHP domain-containing protein [Clostridia bacterium]|nr:PHP domain-containing protein [Clostridia bacterium]